MRSRIISGPGTGNSAGASTGTIVTVVFPAPAEAAGVPSALRSTCRVGLTSGSTTRGLAQNASRVAGLLSKSLCSWLPIVVSPPPLPNSKTVFRGKLDCSRGACRSALTEEWRTHYSDDSGNVRMIDSVERIHTELHAPSRMTMFAVGSALEAEHLRQAHVQLHRPWTATRVTGHSGRS